MTINISLSEESIRNAIDRLKVRKGHLEEDTEQFVEILTSEGAEVAQSAYGNWNVQSIPIPEGKEGTILVAGDMPLIAEFGAGDATLEPTQFFENSPSTPVFPGSYSMFVGSREYYNYGSWRMPYTSKWFTEIPPRHGLFNAKLYIIEQYQNIAKEVMTYD